MSCLVYYSLGLKKNELSRAFSLSWSIFAFLVSCSVLRTEIKKWSVVRDSEQEERKSSGSFTVKVAAQLESLLTSLDTSLVSPSLFCYLRMLQLSLICSI